MKNDNFKQNKLIDKNPWVSLCKLLMCFVVIQNHFCVAGDTILQKIIILLGNQAVPCFMFISFYYMGGKIREKQLDLVSKRFSRLFIPIVMWNITYWIIFNSLYLLTNKDEYIIPVNVLIKSLLFPHYEELGVHLWFLYSQLLIIVFIFILVSLCDKTIYAVIMLSIVLVATYYLEYSGILFELFDSSDFGVKNCFIRTFECIPYSILGTFYSWFSNYINNKIKIIVIINSLIVALLFHHYTPFPAGCGYGGLFLTFSATSICMIVFLLPDFFTNRTRIVINYLGSCTMGIYCVHLLVGRVLYRIWGECILFKQYIKPQTLSFCLFIMVISLALTSLFKILNKYCTKKKSCPNCE